MIFWYTDNPISKQVASCFSDRRHISKFDDTPVDCGVFYGLLRGTGRAMHILKHRGVEFFYIDNGYYDAMYVDRNMQKDMTGNYRFCKSTTLTTYTGKKTLVSLAKNKKVLLIAPSNYAANHYDTTPEDWVQKWWAQLTTLGYEIDVRKKVAGQQLDDFSDYGVVFAFNSMLVLKALDEGLAVYDTHGVFKNGEDILKQKACCMYNVKEVRDFYTKRQFNLHQLLKGEYQWIVRESI